MVRSGMVETRRSRILRMVAESYIATAHPVPSAKIAEALGVSSATVRSEFAALEEEGLLVQPHTSAGRLPTPEGFRRYADAHLPPAPLDAGSAERVRRDLDARHGSDLLRALAALASELSGYAVVLELPADDGVRALEVHLTPISSRRLLAVAVLDNGLTRDLAIPLDPTPDGEVLDDAERLLREMALPLDAMPTALRERARVLGRELRRTLDALADAWPALHPSELVSHGLSLLLEEPESRDPSFVRRAAQWLEHGSSGDRRLGPLGLEFDEDVALIGADLAWRRGSGRLTLVGPARMRYARAFSVAHGIGRSLARPGGTA
jgi:heat-inducible transcriptional repressor